MPVEKLCKQVTRSETYAMIGALRMSMLVVGVQQDVGSLARTTWQCPAAVTAPHTIRWWSALVPMPIYLAPLACTRMQLTHIHLIGHPSTWLRPSVFSEVLRSGTTWRSTVMVVADAPVSTASTTSRRGPMVARSMQLAGRSALSWLPLPIACMASKGCSLAEWHDNVARLMTAIIGSACARQRRAMPQVWP